MSSTENIILAILRISVVCIYVSKFLFANGRKHIGKKVFITLCLISLGICWRDLFFELKDFFRDHTVYRILVYIEKIAISMVVGSIIVIDKKYECEDDEHMWMLVFLSCFPVFTVIWNMGYSMYAKPSWTNQEFQRLALYIGIISWIMFIILDYLLCILYYIMRNGYREREERFRIMREFDIKKKHYADVERMQDKIRGVWHDLSNLLSSAQILLAMEDYDGVKKLLTGTQERLEDPEYVVDTGNPAIDGMLNWKIPKMKLLGLPIETDIEIPAGLELNYEMMATILGNLMDNMIEAQEKIESEKRKATLTLKYMNDMLIIDAMNSCEKEPTLKTTKEDSQNHGFGVANIRHAVDRMGGSVLFDWKDGMFETKILLYRILPKTKNDKQ